jgi:thioredoxin 1
MGNEDSAGTVKSGNGLAVKALIVAALIAAVGTALYLKEDKGTAVRVDAAQQTPAAAVVDPASSEKALPRLVDLGASKCIPCKMMAPILDELKTEYAGKLEVEFIDVWENPGAGEQYGVDMIPTQIFYDASGKERFRHQGFFAKEDILAKWNELGVDLGTSANAPSFSRMVAVAQDTRTAEQACYMCDGDVDPKTRVVLSTEKGPVHLCSPHCLFITYTSLEEKQGLEERIVVTNWSTGEAIPAVAATYLHGKAASGRPTVKAFAATEAAELERQAAGGNILDWAGLQAEELATRCGFCDRAVYPEDASEVLVDGLRTHGCCTMCALGVAARLQKDIEVHAKDALTGEAIRVVTLDGKVAALEPKTAVAWAGMKPGPEGKPVSTGCFKQAFFVSDVNLKKWVEQHPTATGKAVTIGQALADKMKLTPQQISKACKIGECAPR